MVSVSQLIQFLIENQEAVLIRTVAFILFSMVAWLGNRTLQHFKRRWEQKKKERRAKKMVEGLREIEGPNGFL